MPRKACVPANPPAGTAGPNYCTIGRERPSSVTVPTLLVNWALHASPRAHCCFQGATSGVQSLLCHQLQGLQLSTHNSFPSLSQNPPQTHLQREVQTAWNHPPPTSCCSLSLKTSCQLHTALLPGLLPSSTPDPPSGVSSSQQRLKHITKRELRNFAEAYQPIKMDFIRFLFIPRNDLLTLSSNPSPPHRHIHRDLEAGVKRAKEKGKQKLGLSPPMWPILCLSTHKHTHPVFSWEMIFLSPRAEDSFHHSKRGLMWKTVT